MPIIVYNKNRETHDGPNNYFITRPSILSNPYYIKKEGKLTRGVFGVNTRDEAIRKYGHYFDLMYESNNDFRKAVDEIYEKFANNETVYLGCVCKPLDCHGDIIQQKLTNRLVKEKFLKKKSVYLQKERKKT